MGVMPNTDQGSGLATRRWGAVILLLLLMFAQLAFGSRQLSLTSDEPAHLGGGYTYLVSGETWQVPSRGHPPLINAWEALPVVLGAPHIPVRSLPNWGTIALPPYFRALLPLLGPVERLEVAGRVPVMLLGVLLGGLVFRWGADLFGYKGGLLALALMAFDPTMLAHAQLATTDLGVTLLGFATFFLAWRSLRSVVGARFPRPAPWWDVAIGLLCGATMAAKVSGLMWVGLAVGTIFVVEILRSPGSSLYRLWAVFRRSAVILLVAFFFLWWMYGFRIGSVRVGTYVLTVPAPDHWEALVRQFGSTSSRLMFLAGETRYGAGWWWYFPFAFLIKNPIPLLVVWIGAFVLALARRRYGTPADLRASLRTGDGTSADLRASLRTDGTPADLRRTHDQCPPLLRTGDGPSADLRASLRTGGTPAELGAETASLRWTEGQGLTVLDYVFLLGFPAVYVAVAMYSMMNIGYRHLLPIHPFLYVFAAQWAVGWLDGSESAGMGAVTARLRWGARLRNRGYKALWLVLGVWYVIGTVRVFPHYLAYFNELVGGPGNGYRYLVDSNLDWGQGFKALRDELETLDVLPPLRLGHTWYAGPELYGVQYEPIPPLGDDFSVVFSPRFDPPPGTYVLGATLLQRGSGDIEQYEWFRHREPVAQPGYALFVYRVEPHEPPATWIAQCTQPAAPLSGDLIAGEFYAQPLRQVYFDCTQSWVYPEGGEASGWYALHDDVLLEEAEDKREAFLEAHLGQARLSYVHHQSDGMAPAFHLYEWAGGMQAGMPPTADGRGTSGRSVDATSGGDCGGTVYVAPPGMSPRQVAAEGPAVPAPLALDGPLRFLGYRVLEAEARAVSVETWWEVVDAEGAAGRPLSIMAHLVDGEGREIGVADGLGVPVEMWQAGDGIVQRHRFALDTAAGEMWLRTGVYWLDTLERQMVTGPGGTTGDHILIGEIWLAEEGAR